MGCFNIKFLPGLGAGYLYQRRWIPYCENQRSSYSLVRSRSHLNGDTEPTKTEQLIEIEAYF